MTIRSTIATAAAFLVIGLTAAVAEGSIGIHDVRARATVGAGQTSAIYMTLQNQGAEADRLVGVASTVARKTELHTTLQEQGIMKMRPLDGLDLPAGGSAKFMPGGHHVMLIGLEKPLAVGDHFTLTLSFEKAGDIDADVAVVAPGDIKSMSHSGHDMKQGTQ